MRPSGAREYASRAYPRGELFDLHVSPSFALDILWQLPVLADDGSGYSQVSYYFVLGLYVLSFPGIFSLVTRSVKSKVVRKTYEIAGPAAPGGRPTREVAGDIVAFFQVRQPRRPPPPGSSSSLRLH